VEFEECETNNLQILKTFDAYSGKLIMNALSKNQNNHPQIIIYELESASFLALTFVTET
jgi:hypothetical protein